MSILVVKCGGPEGKSFEVEETVTMQSGVLKNFLEEGLHEVKVPNVSSDTMCSMIDYYRRRGKANDEEELKALDNEFFYRYDGYLKNPKQLIEIMKGADRLAFEKLVDVTCQIVADEIRDKRPIEIRTLLEIEGDNTPEEEANAVAWV